MLRRMKMAVRRVAQAAGIEKRKPRIVCWDIETAPNVVTAHSLRNDKPLHFTAIRQEKYIICGSWKVLGERRVHSVSVTAKHPHDDRKVVLALHAMLSSADAIVAHYGDKFDFRMFNARALAHGLKPVPPIATIDTYKIAKRHFLLNSNKLDYLGKVLGLGRKISTSYSLWDGCMDGDSRSLRRMVQYNKQDVRLLERVFLRLRPYMPSHIRTHAFANKVGCDHCGSTRLQFRGEQIVKGGYRKRSQCQACGAWQSGAVVRVKPVALKKVN